MKRIDVLAFKAYSYDTDSFVKDVLGYSKNSILLISYQFDKIIFYYHPSNIRIKNKEIRFWNWDSRIRNNKLSYYLAPLILTMNIILYFKLLVTLCYRYRPKICWLENSYVALIVGFLRRLGLCGRSIYVPGDWLAVKDQRKKLLRYIGNNVVFPAVDYLACKLNDVVLNHTEKIAEARYKFWGRKIARDERSYAYKPEIKTSAIYDDKKRNAICFLGDMRKDSGLEIAIESLVEIRKFRDITLKIIGPQRQHFDYFKKITTEYNVKESVQFLGFIETDKLADALSDCFCGINIITNINSYSSCTIPGKLIHYIQYLLPVIVTEGTGFFASIVKENKLGMVIEPSMDGLVNAVSTLQDNQKQYRENIIRYINSLPKIDIRELIEA